MIHVIATIDLRAGTRDAFLREFAKLVPDVRAERGCLEYRGGVDHSTRMDGQVPVRENVVIVVEKWESPSALAAHLVASHMEAYRERVRDYITDVTLQILDPAGEPA